MRTKVTLVLLLLNVALFFFIFKFELAWRTEDAMREARRRVLGAETAEIKSLAVSSSSGGPSYTVVRNRGVWMLTQPLDWPANEHAVHPILQELRFLENETSFSVADLGKNGQSLADYGLDKPKMTVSFTSSEGSASSASGQPGAGPQTVLRIGDTTKIGNRLYVLSPDGTRIHVVNRSLVDALSIPIDRLRADALFTIPVFEARALSIKSSSAPVRIARREGNRWMFDTIVNARASKMQMDLTIKDLNSLSAASFPSTPPATLPSVSPTLRVTIDGNNRSETLLLGDVVKSASPAPAAATAGGSEPSTEYFAQLMNGNSVRAPVFTVVVKNKLLETLRQAQNALRERRILELDAAAVTSVVLSAPNQPPLTLQRLDASAADSPWQLVRGTGAGAQTQPAEREAVRRLLERLSLLSADVFESDAPSSAQNESWGFNRPEREVTIVQAAPGASKGPIVLQLGTDTAGAVYARSGFQNEISASVYAVTIDLARDLPVDPKQWRDRTLRELPAKARISAIKLTDLATQKVLFETTLGADGKPAANVRSPETVEKLISSLKSLRAKRFVQDGIPDRILIGGDERSWRYQLDTTIALPTTGSEQTSTSTLLLTERVGGAQQLAAAKEFDVVFEVEQPMLDALWTLAYGTRDPGPQLEKK